MKPTEKHLLMSWRLRRIPNGFGWIDHRVLRDGIMRQCTTDALALYVVLILAADEEGISYYGNRLLCSLLGVSMGRLESARENLIHADLIAWEAPLYQVLEISEEGKEAHEDER